MKLNFYKTTREISERHKEIKSITASKMGAWLGISCFRFVLKLAFLGFERLTKGEVG